MPSFRRWAPSSLATLFALALPFTQAQAGDCVEFNGLNHCALGGARLMVEDTELTAYISDSSGEDGVAVETPGAQAWSAGQTCEPSGQDEDTTVTTYYAGGKVVASSTVVDRVDGQTISASFVDENGDPTTYSVRVYSQGRLVASVSGLPSGSVATTSHAVDATSYAVAGAPFCTPYSYKACMRLCTGIYGCNYCRVPCIKGVGNGVWTYDNGVIPHMDLSFQSPFNGITPSSGVKALPETVIGDKIVLISDAPSAGVSQDVDYVQVTSTAAAVSLSDENVTPR